MTILFISAQNDDFNISTAESTTVKELAQLIWDKINGPGSEMRLHFDEPFIHDVQRRVPDVTKAREVLGIECQTSLTEMLDEVIPWVRDGMTSGVI
jgi:nucleoside-diphosphate-sugar epimerase